LNSRTSPMAFLPGAIGAGLCAVLGGVTRLTWIEGRLITTACVAVGFNVLGSGAGAKERVAAPVGALGAGRAVTGAGPGGGTGAGDSAAARASFGLGSRWPSSTTPEEMASPFATAGAGWGTAGSVT